MVPAEAAVSTTVAPVSSVTVMVFPLRTASLAVAVTLMADPARYDPFEVVVENDVIVGAVTSRVMVVEAVAAEAGPVLPTASVAAPAPNTGVTVPAPHEVAVTVTVVPDAALGVNVQVPAEPLFVKSAEARPETDSENVMVYVNDVALVGVDWADVNDVTLGAVVSMTIAYEPAMLLVPVGTDVDVIALPAVSRTVPMVKLETVRSLEFSPDPIV